METGLAPAPAEALKLPAAARKRAKTATGRQMAGNPARWSEEQAHEWYGRQPWIVGANYAPSSAINQLEMWQADTFDPATIERELGWAGQFGMNTMRVYLHDMAWDADPEGFKQRLDHFLTIASRQNIRPVLVLFDSCWDPHPMPGPQRQPIPGVHNSGWVQGPAHETLMNPDNDALLRAYVTDVVGSFAHDRRVLAWDVWNEPDNPGGGNYSNVQMDAERIRIETLLPQVFAWARSTGQVQPLTSGVWIGPDWSPGAATLTHIQRTQLAESDVISFHNYDFVEQFEQRIAQLRPYGRPLICTEWLARSAGSTVDSVLPVAKREKVGMINWGFVQGKIQTELPWDSWERPYTFQQPSIWFHDLLRKDGTPYREREAQIFRDLVLQD